MNKGLISLVGFILFIIGTLALVLSLVGIKFAFLTWIDAFGGGFGLLIRLAMIVIGIVIIVVTRSDFEGKHPI